MRLKDGRGKRNISSVMMAEVPPNCVGQVLIDCASRWDERLLIAWSSPRLIDLLATTSIRCSSLRNLSGVDERLEFVDRPMSDDPHDRLLLQIRGAVSEYERSL